MNPTRSAPPLDRRRLLQGGAALGGAGLLSACATGRGGTVLVFSGVQASAGGPASGAAALAPIRSSEQRLFDITVCLRPFRAQGPRIESEQVGDTLVVHNYGHGGSGWSLSWGSAAMAVRQAMVGSPAEVAVLGCGALGLTAAITAQRAGAKVTIYARDLLSDTRSSRATGTWTPDSRIALTDKAAPGFAAQWEEMARISWHAFRGYLGLPGTPVEWQDRYYLSDTPPQPAGAGESGEPPGALSFANYSDRIRDLSPPSVLLPAGTTPFPAKYVRTTSTMTFNIADYGHTLMTDFLMAGGRFQHHEFHAPSELASLPQKVVINCPGYAARELWKDDSVVPVRGQIGWLVPQPEADYGLYYDHVSVLSRTDGIVIQDLAGGDMRGYNDAHEVPDRAESENAVKKIAELYSRFKTT
jgi:glycine/D-amino acid oxidase-like deaminating enzyme